MKTQFTVKADSVIEFAEILSENELENEITGTTDDDELVIDVHFDKSEIEIVAQLAEIAEEELDENEEDENEED